MEKMYEDMDLDELTAEAKGRIVLAIGDGSFGPTVRQMMVQAWSNGFRQRQKDEAAQRAVALKEKAGRKRKVPRNVKKSP